MATIPQMISADDHVVEPPDLWTSRLAKKWHDRCPRVETHPQGVEWFDQMQHPLLSPGTTGPMIDWWHYEDQWTALRWESHSAGDPDRVRPTGMRFEEMQPACYDPVERLKAMDRDYAEASLCFPNYPRFAGQ